MSDSNEFEGSSRDAADSSDGPDEGAAAPLPPVDLDPADFDWYGRLDADIVVGCFAFGTGIAEPSLAAVGRQIAADFALVLQVHSSFVTVPQMLTVERAAARDDTHFESAFAVFYSLPETRLVKRAAEEIGARIALTGRLVGERQEVHFGANMLDVERTVLLGVTQATVLREELVDAFVASAAKLLRRFSETPESALADTVAGLIGTRSYHAYASWSMANDMDREAQATDRPVNLRRQVGQLCWSLRHDPGFVRPLRRLVELLGTTEDTSALDEANRLLEPVPLRHVSLGLLRGEVRLRLGDRGGAREALQATVDVFPGSAEGFFLLGELESAERPGIAAGHYRHANDLRPDPLYLERLARVEGR